MTDRRRADIPWRTEDTAEPLHDRYRRASNPLVKTRLHAFWLLRQGRTLQEVVTLVGVAYRSLQRWLDWYRQDGLTEVCRQQEACCGGDRGTQGVDCCQPLAKRPRVRHNTGHGAGAPGR